MTLVIEAFHLPTGTRTDPLVPAAAHGDVRAVVPDLSPSDIEGICEQLITARNRLDGMPVARVIRAVDTAARRLLEPDGPAREEALRGIVAFAGYSPPMAAHVLDRMASDWTAPRLHELVELEFGGAAAIESFVRRGPDVRSRAVAPPLSLHVLAGNVPGVGVTSIIRALLVRSAALAKSATDEPVLAPVFARLLTEADPDVGACVAVTWWRGGRLDIEAAALGRAGLVVHYGAADSITSLRDRAPAGCRFVEHGPRISFAILNAAPDVDLVATATALALAVATFDQQGCVSPQLVYVIGTPDRARDFAAHLADALARLQIDLPRGRIDAGEAVAIRELRTRAEFADPDAAALWSGSDLAFSVLVSDDADFEGTCLNRTVRVRSADSIDVVIEAARPFANFLQSVGVEGFTGAELDDIAARLASVGATRVTPFEAMPWPPPGWHHDGRGPLDELVRWVDLES